MKFLIDEDIPVKLIGALRSLGHDVLRVERAKSDKEIAERAKKDDRILITLDKDFSNRALFPPKEFNIIQVQIHPPYAETVIVAITKLLKMVSQDGLQGFIVLQKSGPIRLPE